MSYMPKQGNTKSVRVRHMDRRQRADPYCVQQLTQHKQVCKIFSCETYTYFSGYSFWVQKDFKHERILFCFPFLFFFQNMYNLILESTIFLLCSGKLNTEILVILEFS